MTDAERQFLNAAMAIADLQRRVAALEKDSHPPIDLTPLVKEQVRVELQAQNRDHGGSAAR